MKMNMEEVVNTLKSRNCRHEDKEAAYASLISNLKTQAVWVEELKTQQTELIKLLYRDILDTDDKIVVNAFHILNVCHGQELRESFEKSNSELGLKSLIQCGHKTSSIDVIRCVLDCLFVQKFHTDILINEFPMLLTIIEEMHTKVKAQSTSVVEKIVRIFVRLEKQIGKHSLKSSSPRWSRLVFPGLVNVSHDVREESLTLLEKFREDLCNVQDLSKIIIKALNAGLAKSLKALMYTHEPYVLRAWPLIVQVTGKELHKGSTINSLLEIIEIGFKGSHVGRHNAFIAWRTLIDNFALDRALLLDTKRIKLLLMVLRIDNAKVEHVAVEKLHTWWHFCLCIGAKLSVNFEMIVHPFLQFCVGSGKLQCASELGQSPRLALKTSANNTSLVTQSSTNVKYNLPVFPAVQKLGCQLIARLISKVGKSEDPGKITWSLDALLDEVLGSCAVFVKHAPILMAALEKLLLHVGNVIEENLALHIWISLGNHLKAAMDSAVKMECRDIFSTYLTILHTVTKDQVLPAQTILKMIQTCCSFPQKVLASTAYNITGGQTVRACPAQLLCEVLLTSYLMESAATQEILCKDADNFVDSFIKLFSTLMNAGASNLQGALLFLQTVAEMLDSQALSLPSPEVLWRMWCTLAHTLKDTISTTNEVNQGDALEYNFGCLYSVLLLPIKHQLPSKISQTVNKALLKTWKDLYHCFARLSALVATAEANSCFEEMSAKIIENLNPVLQDPSNLEFVSSICCKMLECVDFSAVTVSQTQSGGLTLSPSKWVRRRLRPLGNLHSFVHLLATLQTEFNLLMSKLDDSGNGKKPESTASMIFFAQSQVEAHTKLFAHIVSTNAISNCIAILARPLATFYQPNAKSNAPSAVKLFVISFWTKLEKLWQEIAQCIIIRYNGSFDSEFLGHLSPLLEATFLHNRRTIKNKTLALWNATFGRNPALEYPSSLKNILIKIKEKSAIILPGLISSDDAVVVAETPYSEMSIGESQVPAPILPILASPKRQKGSLLNRDVSPAGKLSPKPKISPAKIVSSKDVSNLFSGTRKRIELDFLPKETFVVIDSPATKKKRLLTEHQKEVLKQKCVLPAMYNSIDSSQDVSLMSQFGTETQQSMSSTDVIVVNSSQSQEHTNISMKITKSLKDRGNDWCGAPQLRRSTSSSPRRSVRIQELQSSDESKFFEIKARGASTILIAENDFNETSHIEPSSRNSDDKNKNMVDEEDISEQQKSDSPLPSYLCEVRKDSSNECDGSKNIQTSVSNQKDMDAPFLIFRTKQEPVNEVKNLSQSTKSPRRIVLRKVRSQDDIPLSKLKEEMVTVSHKQMKTPRRVPLKKINEQECHPFPESFNHKEPSFEDKSYESPLKNVSKLGCQTALSEQHDTSRTEQSTVSSSLYHEKEQALESISSSEASCTLVEDTQSPYKKKQYSTEIDDSIAETPLKGENSISPPVKAASARKLFVDCDTNVSQTQKAHSHQAASNIETSNKKEEPSNLEESEITSSQGFQIDSVLNIQISAGQSMKSSHMDSGKECLQVDPCALDLYAASVSESENLFPNTQVSNCLIDIKVSTISSPTERLESSLNSSQCESHITLSSDSSEAPNKLSSSSDSDFTCLKPTLAEEDVTYTPNKRKRGACKKFLQVKGKKGCKKHRRVRKGCRHCKNVSSPCTNFGSVSEKKSAEVVDKSVPLSSSSQNTGASTELSNSADGVLHPETPVDSQDSVIFTKNKINDKDLQEIGEVTPDIKSPKSNPERRHSSVKRMRKPSEKMAELKKTVKSSASKKIKIDSADSDKLNSNNKMDKRGEQDTCESSKNKLKIVSPCGKRQPSVTTPDKLRKSKNLPERRSKTIYRRKRRLSTDEKVLSDDDDDDNLSLSSIVKRYKKDDSLSLRKADYSSKCSQTVSDVQSTSDGAVEGSQSSDTVDSENPKISLCCSEADLLIIDAAVNTALHRILESSMGGINNKKHLAENSVYEVATTCNSLESLVVTVSPDISHNLVEPAQSIIILSPENEAQEPVVVNCLPTLEDSIMSDTAESVVNVPKTLSDFTIASSPQEDISTGSSECHGAENTDGSECNNAQNIGSLESNEAESICVLECNDAENIDSLECNNIENIDSSECNDMENIDSSECNGMENIDSSECNDMENIDNSECNDMEIIEKSECNDMENIGNSECNDMENIGNSECNDMENIGNSECNDMENIGNSECNDMENIGNSECNDVENIDNSESNMENIDNSECNAMENIGNSECNDVENIDNSECNDVENIDNSKSNDAEDIRNPECIGVENISSECNGVENINSDCNGAENINSESNGAKSIGSLECNGAENISSECNGIENIDNLECNRAENFVAQKIQQNDSVVDKCINPEHVEIEQIDPDEGISEQNINKTSSENQIVNTTETVNQHEHFGSPERNAIVIYDWSPTRSPSCSILKRCAETPPLGKSRRVSFAEPVVSGESPVREFYKEFASTSPMISQQTSSPGQKVFVKCQGKVSKYRRRLEPLKKQEPTRSPLARKLISPQSPSSYKPTQESQLDNSGPVCPELVDCTNPLDDILPQLTSSLWYRGLCQLMKGRNINTIGDLSALTEVQIDQLPIRHPKVETVKSTLNAYMTQHGLAKSVSSVETLPDGGKIVHSKGSTLEQEVTPASIDDEETLIHPNAEKDLKQLSPIKDSESEVQKMQTVLLELEIGSSGQVVTDDTVGCSALQEERSSQILTGLKEVVKQNSASDWKKVSMDELFDIHQMLNLLFTNVVEEMKSRYSST